MPLHLISGLPNTGRTEKLREEFEEAAGTGRKDPILLVPSVDDVFAWEKRLTGREEPREAGAMAGGRIFHFIDLCREIIRNAEIPVLPLASETRRRLALARVIEAETDSNWLAALVASRISGQPGILEAVLELIDDFRAQRTQLGAAGLGSTSLGGEPDSRRVKRLRESLEPLSDAYEEELEKSGLTDGPALIHLALTAVGGQDSDGRTRWGDSPLFVAGFDDMTGQQLEMIRRLSVDMGVKITMVISWDEELPEGFLSDRLVHWLKAIPDTGTPEFPNCSDVAVDPLLKELADSFLRRVEPNSLPHPPPVTLIEAAGARKEAEEIAARIVKLLASSNVEPDQIAVAIGSPADKGRMIESVLRRFDVPVTLEAETKAPETSTGAAIVALIRAAYGDGGVEDLLVWLRRPGGYKVEVVDELELKCRQRAVDSATAALRVLDEIDPASAGLDWRVLFQTGESAPPKPLEVLADLAEAAGNALLGASIATEELDNETSRSAAPSAVAELEVRMAGAIAAAARDLAREAAATHDGPAMLLEGLLNGSVKVWSVPARGTVRIASPYSLRSKRVGYLFVASLQEGGTRDMTRAGPFLSAIERDGLEMIEKVDPEVQERYLLASCLAVPTTHLWLSCTVTDDNGKATAPSPLIGEIRQMYKDPLTVVERLGSDVSFELDRAPTRHEVARATLVADEGNLDDAGLSSEDTLAIRVAIERASIQEEISRSIGSLTGSGKPVSRGSQPAFSPSALEAFMACPWKWFIERAISPATFGPEAVPMAKGNLIHHVLEVLYREHPGRHPDPDTLESWLSRVPDLINQAIATDDHPLAGDDPFSVLERVRAERAIREFLTRESELSTTETVPAHLEVPFAGIDMGSWTLNGRADRIDVESEPADASRPRAVVIDYKTGRIEDAGYGPGKFEKRGLVQLPLYMRAAGEDLGVDPTAGVVLQVKQGEDGHPRGVIGSGATDLLGGRKIFKNDVTDDLEDVISRAVDLADEAAGKIMRGEIGHSEGECLDHYSGLPVPLGPSVGPRPAPPRVEPEPSEGKEEKKPDDDEIEFSREQQRVIDSNATEIMVAAAAGSGKTKVTVERYKRLLGDEVEPGRILVFTFTEQAAAKLRNDVRKVQEDPHAGAPPVSLSDAWVGTFHSICARILRAYPVEAGIDPSFVVIDDVDSRRIREDALAAALRKWMKGDPKDLDTRLEILASFPAVSLGKLLGTLFDSLRSKGQSRPRLSLPPKEPEYPRAKVEKLLGALESLVGEGEGVTLSTSQLGKCRALLGQIRSAGKDGQIRSADLKILEFSNDKLDTFFALVDSTLQALFEFEGYPVLCEIDRLLDSFSEEYERLKGARNGLDYEDLQLIALRLLRDVPEVGDDYRGRFVEIMVDEFQDTNPLQMELIEALRGDGDGGRTRLMTVGDEIQAIYGFRYADIRIFRDRCQMISSLDPREGELISLRHNYRSEPPILEAVNLIGSDLHDAPDEVDDKGPSLPAFMKLKPGLDSDAKGPLTTLLLTAGDGWDDFDPGPLADRVTVESKADQVVAAEALGLASHIRSLVDAGEFRPGEVAVLVRFKKRIPMLAAALEQFGLPTFVEGSGGFWDTQVVRELMALLSVLANPLDDESLLVALTSPACGVGSDCLLLIRERAGMDAPLWHGVLGLVEEFRAGKAKPDEESERLARDLPELARFRDSVDSLRSRLGSSTLEGLVSEAMEETGLDLANMRRDPASLASLERVATLAADFESREGRSLRGFLEWASLSRQANSEGSVSTVGASDDVVTLMTVHKAKGLEFPLVCVADMGAEIGDREDSVIRLGDSLDGARSLIGFKPSKFPKFDVGAFDWEEIVAEAARETQAEELRLVHVAMTRAERRLVLSGVANKPSAKPTEKSILARSATTRIIEILGLDPVDPATWTTSNEGSPARGLIEVIPNLPDKSGQLTEPVDEMAATRPAGREEEPHPPLARPVPEFYPDVPLSFSGLLEFRRCPTRFYGRRVLRMNLGSDAVGYSGPETTSLLERNEVEPDSALTGGPELGNAVHLLLERSAGAGWEVPNRAAIHSALRAEGLDPDEGDFTTRALEMVEGFLGSALGRQAKGAGREARAEVPIVLGIGGVTIRGFIDLLVKTDDATWVIDYKTNQLKGRDPEELMEGYELQRDLYALAVARARGLDSIGTSFVFLEAADRSVEKAYDREALDEAERRLTLEVVEPITNARYFGGEGEGPDPCGRCEACRIFGLGSG